MTDAEPFDAPVHPELEVEIAAVIGIGVIVAVTTDELQPCASVIVHVYVPAPRPVAVTPL
jgi:hypothetical protein